MEWNMGNYEYSVVGGGGRVVRQVRVAVLVAASAERTARGSLAKLRQRKKEGFSLLRRRREAYLKLVLDAVLGGGSA